MKFKITMKDPNCFSEKQLANGFPCAIDDACEGQYEYTPRELENMIKKWFKWGEYLTVEIDTETETIRVLEENE